MKRKFEIPKMNDEVVQKWHKAIRPILFDDGPKFMHPVLSDHAGKIDTERFSCSYLGYPHEPVDYAKLSVLADVKMLHFARNCCFCHFKATPEEVIRQIPEDLLEKTVAYQFAYTPSDSSETNLFKEELDAGYYVSIVRLYQVKGKNTAKAKPISAYPVKDSSLPIGMSEDEFKKLKEFKAQRA